MNYKEIIKNYTIESVKVRGCTIIINGSEIFEYKYPAVAKAVAKKVSMFIGIK